VLDVSAAVRSVEPMLRRLIGENIKLSLDLDPATGNVRADSGQLDQIFINLVVNARDAMLGGGSITIQTTNAVFDEPFALEQFEVAPGNYVVLAVSDTGEGMDRTTKEHIFEPFFTTKETGKGTGLGLATIYGIVRQAGGHIWLYSEPGHGSTFKLYFPRVDAPLSAATAASSAPQPGGGQLVLVTEDEPAVREMTTLMLRRGGYRVVSAVDGAEALVRLATSAEPIDVLVTDVIMPGMSGIELAERTMDRMPNIGIVLVSGYLAETLDLERLIARGAVFAAKPATSTLLLNSVHRALTSRQPVDGAPA
jgi:CheY-like chemotaxis protein